MQGIEIFSYVIAILSIIYTALWIYFCNRQDIYNKEFKNRVNNFKINKNESKRKSN